MSVNRLGVTSTSSSFVLFAMDDIVYQAEMLNLGKLTSVLLLADKSKRDGADGVEYY